MVLVGACIREAEWTKVEETTTCVTEHGVDLPTEADNWVNAIYEHTVGEETMRSGAWRTTDAAAEADVVGAATGANTILEAMLANAETVEQLTELI